MSKSLCVVLTALTALAASKRAQADPIDWNSVKVIKHAEYQAVQATGASDYLKPENTDQFPLRLRGIVLNNNEQWLDPTADPTNSTTPWFMGGQAEIFIQAVSDPASPYYVAGDFGGTKAWMGENYGNHGKYVVGGVGNPAHHYTDAQWYAELDRLHLWRPGGPTTGLVRAGDLVEVQARIGLNYQGSANINENHSTDADLFDFEIVLLQAAAGLPDPADVTITSFKDAVTNQYLFDHTRATGGEHYQSTLVRLHNVRLQSTTGWGPNADLVMVDAAGLTLPLKLGIDASFAGTAPDEYFDVVGIINQTGGTNKDGYRLLALEAGAFTEVPEPASALLVGLGGLLVLRRRRRRRAA